MMGEAHAFGLQVEPVVTAVHLREQILVLPWHVRLSETPARTYRVSAAHGQLDDSVVELCEEKQLM